VSPFPATQRIGLRSSVGADPLSNLFSLLIDIVLEAFVNLAVSNLSQVLLKSIANALIPQGVCSHLPPLLCLHAL
jgi:hypothetical protein